MRQNRSIPSAAVVPVLIYPDVREAVAWLKGAFGFAERVRIGDNHRSQLRAGEGAVIVGDVRHDRRPPRAGETTHSVLVRVEDVESHCARARAHGAEILEEPTDFDYGERQYTAADPAGHRWTSPRPSPTSTRRAGAASSSPPTERRGLAATPAITRTVRPFVSPLGVASSIPPRTQAAATNLGPCRATTASRSLGPTQGC